MTWQDVGQFVAKAAPALGGILAGPGGAAAGELLAMAFGVESAPDKVIDALKSDPSAIMKLRELESNERVRLEEIRIQADTAGIQAVNETMRAEISSAPGQAWYQKAWRPANGFAVAIGSVLSIVFVCYLFYKALTSSILGVNVIAVINTLPAFAAAIAAILAIPGAAVGIAAWHRGKLQRIQEGEGKQ